MANTIGGTSPAKKLGKYAPGLIYAGIITAQTTILIRIITGLEDKLILREVSSTYNGEELSMIKIDFFAFVIIMLALVLVIGLYFAIINYFHKKKLSVQ